jgi:phage/plasmid-like protein (TIGR03299 family)
MRDKLACTGQHPWHFAETNRDGRTVMVGEEPQSGETMRAVALPWEPVKVPLFFAGSHAESYAMLNRHDDLRFAESFAVVRNDGGGILTKGRAVSDSYTPFTNSQFVAIGDLLVASGEAKWHTLGSLLGGKHVYGSIQAAGDVQVIGANGTLIDSLAPFLMLFSAHDGTHSLEAMFTTIRPVCHNTVTAARNEAGKGKAKIRHTLSIADTEGVADRIAEILGMARKSFEEQAAVLSDLARIQMNRTAYVEFIAQVLTGEDEVSEAKAAARAKLDAEGSKAQFERKSATLLGCIEDGIGQRALPDSGYKALQGLVEYIDHQRSRSAAWRSKNKALGLDNALFGTGDAAKRRAVQLLLRRS